MRLKIFYIQVPYSTKCLFPHIKCSRNYHTQEIDLCELNNRTKILSLKIFLWGNQYQGGLRTSIFLSSVINNGPLTSKLVHEGNVLITFFKYANKINNPYPQNSKFKHIKLCFFFFKLVLQSKREIHEKYEDISTKKKTLKPTNHNIPMLNLKQLRDDKNEF